MISISLRSLTFFQFPGCRAHRFITDGVTIHKAGYRTIKVRGVSSRSLNSLTFPIPCLLKGDQSILDSRELSSHARPIGKCNSAYRLLQCNASHRDIGRSAKLRLPTSPTVKPCRQAWLPRRALGRAAEKMARVSSILPPEPNLLPLLHATR